MPPSGPSAGPRRGVSCGGQRARHRPPRAPGELGRVTSFALARGRFCRELVDSVAQLPDAAVVTVESLGGLGQQRLPPRVVHALERGGLLLRPTPSPRGPSPAAPPRARAARGRGRARAGVAARPAGRRGPRSPLLGN